MRGCVRGVREVCEGVCKEGCVRRGVRGVRRDCKEGV